MHSIIRTSPRETKRAPATERSQLSERASWLRIAACGIRIAGADSGRLIPLGAAQVRRTDGDFGVPTGLT